MHRGAYLLEMGVCVCDRIEGAAVEIEFVALLSIENDISVSVCRRLKKPVLHMLIRHASCRPDALNDGDIRASIRLLSQR
jgi:hypothetical protein